MVITPSRRPYLRNAVLALALTSASLVVSGGLYWGAGAERKQLTAFFGDEATLREALVRWWVWGAVLVVALMLSVRRPVVALALAGAAGAAHLLDPRFGVQPLDLIVPVVLFLVAATARARWTSATVLAGFATGVYLINLVNELTRNTKAVPVGKALSPVVTEPVTANLLGAASGSFQVILVLGLAVAVGDSVRSRKRSLQVMEQRAGDLEREQLHRAALAAAAERSRIARELHDVVAHSLSVIVAQAQGATAALRRHPDRAETALHHVIEVGRGSLGDMRRLLGVLGHQPGTSPEPGLGAMAELIDGVRLAGLPVRLHLDGEPIVLPSSVDLSAYRIVQEALTNALKHAGAGAEVVVSLKFTLDSVEIEVTDDGLGSGSRSAPGGHGLRGIAERVDKLGGELAVGPGRDGGFQVKAKLPIEVGV
ncbi:MAG: hypothetical protein QOI21_4151 [Actinomycetota bacterium]|nr:hypothetical protein [Actinomycetota bacterium]